MLRAPFAIFGRLFAIAVVALASMGFSAFDMLDNFMPKDAGATQVARDIPFGAGPRRTLDIYAPEGLTNTAPVILFIYGGSWNRGAKHDYEFAGFALASRGFVTVIADYRIVPEVTYPGFVEDGAAAIRWIERNISTYGGDPKRLFLVGHSAGAYNAVMLALEPSFLRDAGATVAVRGVAALSGPFSFYPFRVGEAQAAFGSAPNPEGTQPVNLVTPDSPPMFLATGEADLIVRPSNTTLLADALRAKHVRVEAVSYPGLGHMDPVMALSTVWRARAPVLDQITAFFTSLGAFNPASTEPPLLSP